MQNHFEIQVERTGILRFLLPRLSLPCFPAVEFLEAQASDPKDLNMCLNSRGLTFDINPACNSQVRRHRRVVIGPTTFDSENLMPYVWFSYRQHSPINVDIPSH